MLTEEKRNRVNELLKELTLEVENNGPLLKPQYDEATDRFEFGLKIMCPFAVTYEYLEMAEIKPTRLAYMMLEQVLTRTLEHIDIQIKHVQSKLRDQNSPKE